MFAGQLLSALKMVICGRLTESHRHPLGRQSPVQGLIGIIEKCVIFYPSPPAPSPTGG